MSPRRPRAAHSCFGPREARSTTRPPVTGPAAWLVLRGSGKSSARTLGLVPGKGAATILHNGALTTNRFCIRGGCLCGGVRYELRAPFRRANFCHCTRCRKHSGAAALAVFRHRLLLCWRAASCWSNSPSPGTWPRSFAVAAGPVCSAGRGPTAPRSRFVSGRSIMTRESDRVTTRSCRMCLHGTSSQTTGCRATRSDPLATFPKPQSSPERRPLPRHSCSAAHAAASLRLPVSAQSSRHAGATASGVMQPSAIGAGDDCCDRGRSRSSRALWRRAARQAAPGAHDGSPTGCDGRAHGVAVTAGGPEFGPPYDGRLLTDDRGLAASRLPDGRNGRSVAATLAAPVHRRSSASPRSYVNGIDARAFRRRRRRRRGPPPSSRTDR